MLPIQNVKGLRVFQVCLKKRDKKSEEEREREREKERDVKYR